MTRHYTTFLYLYCVLRARTQALPVSWMACPGIATLVTRAKPSHQKRHYAYARTRQVAARIVSETKCRWQNYVAPKS